MSAVGSFISRLKDSSEVCDAVDGRIFAGNAAPDSPVPYIVVMQAGGTDIPPHQSGASPIHQVQLLVDSYAASMTEAEEIGDKVRMSSDGLEHKTIGNAPNRVFARSLVLSDESPDPVQLKSGAGITVYRWNQNWLVWADRPAPVFS